MFLWGCFYGGVVEFCGGGVLAVVFLWWCGGVFVAVWWCGGVFVVVFLWW